SLSPVPPAPGRARSRCPAARAPAPPDRAVPRPRRCRLPAPARRPAPAPPLPAAPARCRCGIQRPAGGSAPRPPPGHPRWWPAPSCRAATRRNPGMVPRIVVLPSTGTSMRIEIICTGDEVLTGKIVNTNFSYMSQKLEDVGLSVHWGTTVGDDRETLLAAFRLAADRADAVIVNGGAGPPVGDPSQASAAQAGRGERV